MSVKEDIASALFKGSFTEDEAAAPEPPLSFPLQRWYVGDERSPVERIILPDQVKTNAQAKCQCPSERVRGLCDGCGTILVNNPGIPDGVGFQSALPCKRLSQHGYMELCADCYRKTYKERYPDLEPPI